MTKARSMYVRAESNGTFTLRQERYRKRLETGKEHPHDVCAVASSREELRTMCQPHWPDVDYGAASQRRKFTVYLQQYVEKVAAVVVEATDEDEARSMAYRTADAAEWLDGDDAYKVEAYEVADDTGEIVWSR